MFQRYSWDGKTISDIRKWAKDRGEKLVHYELTKSHIDINNGKIVTETQTGKVPESFWNCLLSGAGSGFYKEIKREDP